MEHSEQKKENEKIEENTIIQNPRALHFKFIRLQTPAKKFM